MEEVVWATGCEGAGFVGVNDIVGNGRDFGGEIRTGEKAAKSLDAHRGEERGISGMERPVY